MSKFVIAAVALALTSTTALAQADNNELNGRWLINDGGGQVLRIRGSEWLHPVNGDATIRKGQGAATLEVFYSEHTQRCRYRHYFADMGDKLVLIAQDGNQHAQFCPSGTFIRVSR